MPHIRSLPGRRLRGGASAIAAALALGAPAIAQQAVPDNLDYRFMVAASPCMDVDEAWTPQDVIDVCETSMADLNALRSASPGLTRHEDNIYLFEMMMLHSAIGSRMGLLDGSRSRRVCEQMEKSWLFASRLVPAESTPEYAKDLARSQEQTVEIVRLCRSEFGAPATASPLP